MKFYTPGCITPSGTKYTETIKKARKKGIWEGILGDRGWVLGYGFFSRWLALIDSSATLGMTI